MKNYNLIAFFLLGCILFNFVNKGLSNENLPPLIPRPKFIKAGYGCFRIDSRIQFVFNSEDKQISEIVSMLENEIKTIFDKSFQFKKSETPDDDAINIRLIRTEMPDSLAENGYILGISQESIIIKAGTDQGFFYAGTTLRQLILFSHEQDNNFAEIPVMIIADRPQYKWRGLMLDVARRYLSIDFIRKHIDLLAFYKMNILHLHLTDDQGWRIQIDKYPKLVTIGSNLKDKDGLLNTGFYSKDDIREIVAYAAVRKITVVPEIEFPGHCVASLNAYPKLSCTGGPFENESNVGALYLDNYCLGKDSVFSFIFNVLDEIFELFPSEYIHIGGDEAPEIIWTKCKNCQARIQNEGLKGEDELQSWAIRRVNDYIQKNGRKLIGWTEIIKGGLPEGTVVHSWTGFEGAITAAKQKQMVIISNGYYFNILERGGNDGLQKVYLSDLLVPALSSAQRKFMFGGEGCVWGMKEDFIDKKVIPRLLAMAESFWLNQSQKNYPEFYNRLQKHYPVLTKWGFQIGLEEPPINWHQSFSAANNSINLMLSPGQKDIQIRYTVDDREPELSDPVFEDTLKLDRSFDFKARPFMNGAAVGETKDFSIEWIKNNALSVISNPHPTPNYIGIAGNKTLIDGFRASLVFNDQFWQAFLATDVSFILDLGQTRDIHKITIGMLHDPGPGIFLPKKVEFLVSEHPDEFNKVGETDITINDSFDKYKKNVSIEFRARRAKFVKVKLTSYGSLPEWHYMFGNGETFIFVDEIWTE